MVAGLVLVLVVLVGWAVARRQLRRLGAARDGRPAGTTFVLGLPPVPEPRPRPVVAAPPATAPPVIAPPVVVLPPPVAPPRPVRRCGHCRAVGHTRPACPRLTGALPLPHL